MQPSCSKACVWSCGRTRGQRPQGSLGSVRPQAETGDGSAAARRPGRAARGAGTRRASEGSCRVTFPRESGPSSPLEASLPFVCFPAGGWRAAGFLLLYHAPRGPCDSPDLPGVPARMPWPVLAGSPSVSVPERAAAPRSPRSCAHRRGGPPPVFAAPVSGVRDLGASAGRPVTRGDGLELRKDPCPAAP